MADGEKAATAYTIGWGPQKGRKRPCSVLRL